MCQNAFTLEENQKQGSFEPVNTCEESVSLLEKELELNSLEDPDELQINTVT